MIKETKLAGGSKRAHNVDIGVGLVLWTPTRAAKMNTLRVYRSLSECLESVPFVSIVL